MKTGYTKWDELRFQRLVADAMSAFDALTPLEQALHRRAQAISFAYGQVALSGSTATREMVAEEHDRRHPALALMAADAIVRGMRVL